MIYILYQCYQELDSETGSHVVNDFIVTLVYVTEVYIILQITLWYLVQSIETM